MVFNIFPQIQHTQSKHKAPEHTRSHTSVFPVKAFASSKTLLFVKWCGFWERTCCSLAGWLPGFDTKPHYSCRNIFLLFRLTLSLNLIQKGDMRGKRGRGVVFGGSTFPQPSLPIECLEGGGFFGLAGSICVMGP